MPPHIRLGRRTATSPLPTSRSPRYHRVPGVASPPPPGFADVIDGATPASKGTPTTGGVPLSKREKQRQNRSTINFDVWVSEERRLMSTSSSATNTTPTSSSSTNITQKSKAKKRPITIRSNPLPTTTTIAPPAPPTPPQETAPAPAPAPAPAAPLTTATSAPTSAPTSALLLTGQVEIAKTSEWIAEQLAPLIGAKQAKAVQERLIPALRTKFAQHWHVSHPSRGSGFRCLRSEAGKVDPVVLTCMQAEVGKGAAAICAAQLVFAVWTDPGEVSVRLGEHGKISLILAAPSAVPAFASAERRGGLVDNNAAFFSSSSSSSDSDGGWDSPAVVRRSQTVSPTMNNGALSPSAHTFSPVRSATPPPTSPPHTNHQHQPHLSNYYNQFVAPTAATHSPQPLQRRMSQYDQPTFQQQQAFLAQQQQLQQQQQQQQWFGQSMVAAL